MNKKRLVILTGVRCLFATQVAAKLSDCGFDVSLVDSGDADPSAPPPLTLTRGEGPEVFDFSELLRPHPKKQKAQWMQERAGRRS